VVGCGHVGEKQCSAAPPCSGKRTAVSSPIPVLEQLRWWSPSPSSSSSSRLLLSPLVQHVTCGHEVVAWCGGRALGHLWLDFYSELASMARVNDG
jgi:hypothetical protein